MNDIAIQVEKLGKQFYIGRKQEKYRTLRDTLADAFSAPLRKAGNLLRGHAAGAAELNQEIWALKDVSFSVRRGEVIGIIGSNGAGKSTLLKILSRITEPTEGHADIRGRVGSLLEVGTGFHSELTGRENVFLNGAILGMKRVEIQKKFDEIVAFSQVENFIDTPVKHYSSGMYLRLAFAVAAHLETEILLLDEVLAVGDNTFQKKCLGKMGDVAKEGRTVLFVSHNMGAIENLCQSGIWIEKGKVARQGEVSSIVKAYLQSETALEPVDLKHLYRKGNGHAQIVEVRLLNAEGQRSDTFLMGEDLIVEFDVEAYKFVSSLNLTLEVKRVHLGMNVLHLKNEDCGLFIENIAPGPHRFSVKIPNCMLYPASYNISLHVAAENGRVTVDHLVDFMSFSMIQSGVTKRTSRLSLHRQAIFYVPSEWRHLPIKVGCHE